MTRSVLCLASVLLVVWLQPSSGVPVDTRDHKLKTLLDKTRRGDDLCLLCKATVTLLKEYLEENGSVQTLYPVLEPLCVYFMDEMEGYNGAYMCPGIIYSYVPVIFDIIAEGALNPNYLCQLLQLCGNSQPQDISKLLPSLHSLAWRDHKAAGPAGDSASIVLKGEARSGISESNTGRMKVPSGGDRKIVFLHLSDIHLDRQYSEGSPSVCNLYLCCRSWYNGTGPAGHYGDYKCDLPLVTLDIVVDTIAELDPKPDFIIYTGDNSPHDMWNETWSSQYQYTDYLISYLIKKLPGRVIYPALGNHETYPESEYIGTLPQYQELTHKMAQYWQSLVPLPQSALDTIADGGYYTLLISERLRLLSFNSDYGFSLNLYTTLNGQNPYYSRQQSWIIDTLHQARQEKEKVIIIAHIPPGHLRDTLPEYEEFYLNLTRCYHDIIVGHLFGHTHHDEFKLVQDEDGVYGTVMASPSVTPRSRSNPSFRVFTMDPSSSYQLLGYQQYHLNLTLANEMAGKGMKPKMELAYTTSDLYHLPDLSPSSWANLVERFREYPDLVSEYNYNKYGQSSSHDLSCDTQCIRDTICTVSTIISLERIKCINDSE